MPSPRTRRLMLDEETLQRLLQGWPLIQIAGKAGIPPEIYRFTYNLRGLYVSGSGEILERDSHVLEVNLTLGYPRRAPQCRMLTPVFHPNFDDSMVCIGDFWAASEGLDQLIIRIGRMITYQEYNTRSPLNGLAAKWAAQNAHLLPIDPRPVAPPLNGAPQAPAQQEADKPIEVPLAADVPAAVDDQWNSKIVIAPENSAVLNETVSDSMASNFTASKSAVSSPVVSGLEESKTEPAALSQEDGSPRRRMLFLTLVAILVGSLIWYGFHRLSQRQAEGAGQRSENTNRSLTHAINPETKTSQRAGRRNQLRESVMQLPASSNPEALRAEANARKSMLARDNASAITALKYAVSLDPTFSRAWIELGWIYSATGDTSSALGAYRKGVEADATQVVPYKILGYEYAFLANRDEAIATWKKLQIIAPADPDIAPSLGGLYMAQKRYPEALAIFESAAKAYPSDAFAQMRLGMVQLRSRKTDEGMQAMHKALQLDPGPEMLNDVAYEMAEADTNFAEALDYSLRSVKEAEEQSQRVDFRSIQQADLELSLSITAYWDTLGWIYFKMGDLARAESYLTPAWQLREDGLVGDHLGQVYERQKKLSAALHMYKLAFEANPRLEETPSRIRNLANVSLPQKQMDARDELTSMRTVRLPDITRTEANADFNVLFAVS